MQRIDTFDGLRAVAMLIVFGLHAGVPGFGGGGAGVDIFFVLSGFLITGLLLRELDETGRLDLPRFYLRRLRRLTPPVLLIIAAALFFGFSDPAGVALAASYMMDYARAFDRPDDALGHMWSLAVEEHFYLVWPLALLLIARLPKRRWALALAAAYLAATLWRCGSLHFSGYDAVYFRFDTRLSGLFLGALLAVLLDGGKNADRTTLAVLAAGLAVVLLATPWSGGLLDWSLGFGIFVAEATALRVSFTLKTEESPSLIARTLALRPLVYIGRISYGMYLYQYPITHALGGLHWTIVVVVALPATIALAALSYHLVERPIMDGRLPFGPQVPISTRQRLSRQSSM